jgi:uncharacterized protein DUF5666
LPIKKQLQSIKRRKNMDKRIIIRSLYTKLLSIFLLVGLTACSGGGSDSTSNGSGDIKVASGTIIGFGSVIVNGIEFSRKAGLADDRVKLLFEDKTSASENSLFIGMTVNIRGTIDNATGKGEYESIEFQPELRGPLDSVDTTAGTLTIMGRQIQVDTNTSFDSGISGLSDIIQAGNNPELEISGNLDNSTGILHATRIARKALDFNARPEKTVQIKGKIVPGSVVSGASSGSFTIGTVSVNFTSAELGSNTTITDIAADSVVEVKGVLNGAGNVITASRIEKKKAVDAGVNDSVKLKGTANGGVVGDTFTISGPNGAITVNVNVNTAKTIFQKNGATATATIVTAGATLEVEGILQGDGSVAATKVYLEVEKTVKLEGNAAAGAFNAGTLTLNGVPVIISATTRLLDISDLPLDPASIAVDDHLQISGIFDSSNNKVTASQVQRTSGKKGVTFIQGPVTATASPRLTLIGIITVDTSGVVQATGFGDSRTGTAVKFSGQAAFFAALTSDGFTVVKAKGTVSETTLSATEVELEQAQ